MELAISQVLKLKFENTDLHVTTQTTAKIEICCYLKRNVVSEWTCVPL